MRYTPCMSGIGLRAARSGRVLHLDVLRAAAILLVLGVHAPGIPSTAWGYTFYDEWRRCGWAGVDLFFALSGYLIVGLLLDERHRTGTIDVKAFAWRRVFKIYPPYILFLGAAIAWTIHSGARPGAAFAAFWPTVVHLQNYIPVRAAPHLWSLAMEEHCYALMLGLVLFAGRRADPLQSRTIPFALLIAFAASWLGRLAYILWGYAGSGPIGYAYTHNRLDAVLSGSFVAWLVQGLRARSVTVLPVWTRWKRLMLLGSAVCFVPTLTVDLSSHRPLVVLGVFPAQALGFGLLLLGLAASARTREEGAAAERRPAWLLRALAFVGISSYSTYLWHWPFAAVLTREIHLGSVDAHPAGPAAHLTMFVAAALALGAVSFGLIEKPALACRRRWLASKAPRPQSRRTPSQSLGCDDGRSSVVP